MSKGFWLLLGLSMGHVHATPHFAGQKCMPSPQHSSFLSRSVLIPRGGAKKYASPQSPPSSTMPIQVDWAQLGKLAQFTAQKIWDHDMVQRVANTSPADVVKSTSSFLKNQQNAANQRREQYRQESLQHTTNSVVLSAPRALKLTLAAFVLAEILQFVDKNTGNWMGTLKESSEVLATDFRIQVDNFIFVGCQEGGLLRAATWTNAQSLTNAVQEQIQPKYQWAIGAALGFVVSPIVWSLGWTLLGWTAGVYVLGEVHHLCKANYPKYYSTLKDWQNPVIYTIDDWLEDLRIFVEASLRRPQEQIQAIRIDLNQRFDFEFPQFVQNGLLFGAIVGVVTGA